MTKNQGKKMTLETDPSGIQIRRGLSDSVVKIIGNNMLGKWQGNGNLSRNLKSIKEKGSN